MQKYLDPVVTGITMIIEVDELGMVLSTLAGQEPALGKHHPTTLLTANNMGIVSLDQGKYDEVFEYLGRE